MQTTYIELAGIPIEVRSQYNSDFLQEFITNRPPLLKVEPGEEDLARMRKALGGVILPPMWKTMRSMLCLPQRFWITIYY